MLLDPLCSAARKKATCAVACESLSSVRQCAIDPDGVDSNGRSDGVSKGRGVAYCRWIEEHKVSTVAFGDLAAPSKSDAHRGHGGHFANGLGK